jgi:monoamine oxidase
MSYSEKILNEKIYDRIIIGAGIAGITAGLTFLNSKKDKGDFLILEASNKIGGRAQSEIIEIDGKRYIVDLGPAWFHRMQGESLATQLEKTVKTAGYREFLKDKENVLVFYNDKKFSKKHFYKIAKILERVVYGSTSQTESIAEVLQDKIAKKTKKFGGIVHHIANAEFGEVDAGASITEVLNHDYINLMDRTDGMLPTYGIGNIIKDFAEPLVKRNLIKLDNIVEEVFYKNGLVNIKTNNGSYKCKEVFFALPNSAYKKIKFDEIVLPNTHSQAIENLQMGYLEKVFIFFKDDFYKKHNIDKITHLHVYNDLPDGSRETKFYLLVPQKNYAMMLIGGEQGKELASKPKIEKLDYAISGINSAFKTNFLAEDFLDRSIVTNWANEPFIDGAYSVRRKNSKKSEDFFEPRKVLSLPITHDNRIIARIIGEAVYSQEQFIYYDGAETEEVTVCVSTHISGAFQSARTAALKSIDEKWK